MNLGISGFMMKSGNDSDVKKSEDWGRKSMQKKKNSLAQGGKIKTLKKEAQKSSMSKSIQKKEETPGGKDEKNEKNDRFEKINSNGNNIKKDEELVEKEGQDMITQGLQL